MELKPGQSPIYLVNFNFVGSTEAENEHIENEDE